MEPMEIDNNPNIVQILMPDGSIQKVDASKMAKDVIKHCTNNVDHEDYALVFFGRKLNPGQKLEDVPNFNTNRPIRLIRQKSSQKTALNKEEIGKLLKQCRNAYKSLIEDAYPPQISGESYKMLLSYIVENKGENYKDVIKEFPDLAFDQHGHDTIRDWRLLIPTLMESDKFAYEHPHCLQVFKKALDKISNKYSSNSPFIRFGPDMAGPSHLRQNPHNNQAADATPSQPLITPQQLSNALAIALGGAPATPSQSQTTTPAQQDQEMQQPLQNEQNFVAQLQQMHDFGFTNNEENMQALMLSNGDVEQALQIVIAIHEE